MKRIKHRFTEELLEQIIHQKFEEKLTWVEISSYHNIPDTTIREALKNADMYTPRDKLPDGKRVA